MNKGVWMSMDLESPPRCQQPIWLEVIYKDCGMPWSNQNLKDGEITTVCWWYDHPYCSMLTIQEIAFWRIKEK